MNLLKSISILLCAFALTIPLTVDASSTTTTTTTTTFGPIDSFGFPTYHHMSEKNITFINWSQAYHKKKDKEIIIEATCLRRQRLSSTLENIVHHFYAAVGTEAILPATGRDVNYTEGLYEKSTDDNCVGLRLVKYVYSETLNMYITDLASQGSFQLFRNLQLLPQTHDGFNVIGLDCKEANYSAYIRYKPKRKYSWPSESTDPKGHYALYESCYD